jgi:hypothetical protein
LLSKRKSKSETSGCCSVFITVKVAVEVLCKLDVVSALQAFESLGFIKVSNCKATSAMAFAEISEDNIKDLLSTKDRIYTNHSIRAMIITEMDEAGIDKSEDL